MEPTSFTFPLAGGRTGGPIEMGVGNEMGSSSRPRLQSVIAAARALDTASCHIQWPRPDCTLEGPNSAADAGSPRVQRLPAHNKSTKHRLEFQRQARETVFRTDKDAELSALHSNERERMPALEVTQEQLYDQGRLGLPGTGAVPSTPQRSCANCRRRQTRS